MAQPVQGAGFLLVNDILSDVSYALIQNPVNTVAPAGGIPVGFATVPVFDPSMYPGAQILVGTVGVDLEVVTIISVNPGISFQATFALPHAAGAPIIGATFPVRQTSDPLYQQGEMLAYASTALNDFLTEVPLVYTVSNNVTVQYTQQNTQLPADSMFPVRIAAFGYPLRETSIPNLETYDFRYNVQAAQKPLAYFRNDNPLQSFGVWPRCNNDINVEIVYAARSAQTLGLADGLPIPDPLTLGMKYRILEFAYSKDGEARNPGLAKFWGSRYNFFVKVAKVLLGIIEDPNMEMSAG